MFGEGFYTSVGRKGAIRSGITIRFEVDPNAREGTDFTWYYYEYSENLNRVQEGDYIIWKNKNAIRIIPESLDFSPSEYFEFLREEKKIDPNDQAILWKLKIKLDYQNMSGRVSFQESEKIRKIILDRMNSKNIHKDLIFSEWIKFEGIRLKKSLEEISTWIQHWKTKSYEVNPDSFFSVIHELSKDTGLEKYFKEEWLPSVIETLKSDVGDRVLEQCLFSHTSLVQKFSFRALAERNDKKPTPFTQALQKILKHKKNPRTWIQSTSEEPEELQQKAAYLALHPELRLLLPSSESQKIESLLSEISFLPLFETLLNGPLPENIRKESFQFHSYQFPTEGLKVTLGSPPNEEGRWYSQEDQYEVLFTRPFEIQVTPVTRFQWALILGEDPSLNPNHPIDPISWLDTQRFIQRLNELDPHYIYRLPTEAEWEFAARGGTQTPYHHGNSLAELQSYAWTIENSNNETHPVASLKPNPDGLYDTHGNVWEWVQDWWEPIRPSPSADPTGPELGKDRILRGGSSGNLQREVHSARRLNYNPESRRHFSGFRLVRTPRI